MNTLNHRVEALEAIPGAQPSTPDDDYSWWMSSPSLIVVAGDVSKELAQRRFQHDHGPRAWNELIDAERRTLIRVERARFGALLRSEPTLHDALRLWLAEGDGLDPLGWGKGQDYAAFVERLAVERAMLALHRAASDRLGTAWRRRHPEWRGAMSPDEMDQWEASLGKGWVRS